MGKIIDLTGQKFEKLTVIKKVENYVSPKGQTQSQWLCKCDCGSDKDGNEIINNFMEQFRNIIVEFNVRINPEEKISYCESKIGKRNALILYIMLSDFYEM